MTALIIEHHTITRDDLHWHVATTGPADAPPVLLLHCWCGNWQFWQSTITQLAGQYRCIIPDHLGFGSSDKPSGDHYRIPDQAERARYIMAHFGVDRARVIGHSMGGQIALALAGAYPEVVERLVVIDPVVTGRLDPLVAFGEVGLGPVREWGITWPLTGFIRAGLAAPHLSALFMSPFFAHPLEQIEAGQYFTGQVIADDQAEPAAWAYYAAKNFDVTPLLGQITAPTLVLWGERDHCVPVTEADVLAANIPNVQTCLVPDAGHYPMIEAFGDYIDSVRSFLAAPPASDRRCKQRTRQ